jgi:hypothetical protein
MANKKISELTAVPSSLTGSEPLPLVQAGVTYKATLQSQWNQVANLTVQGSATISGTAHFTTAIKHGPDSYIDAGWHKLGSASVATGTGAIKMQVAFTNTSNTYHRLHVLASGKGQTSTTNFILCLYTDGGTTPFLTYPMAANASATASEGVIIADVYGANADVGFKLVVPICHFPSVATQATQTRSATVNTGVVNAVSVSMGATGTTASLSVGHMVVYGLTK